MIVVASSAENAMSKWVKAEWRMFVNEMRAGRKQGNLITVLIGDVNPHDLPLSLRCVEAIRFGPEAFERIFRYVRR